MAKMKSLVRAAIETIELRLYGWLTNRFEVRRDFVRRHAASRYLRGRGIEIGALHCPLRLPAAARARYVDCMDETALRERHPELRDCALVHVDAVDDGERLATFHDASQDFVIANHFLEHCENPILALENMVRVARPDAIVFLTVPDKRFTVDKDRPTTPYSHLEADYRNGPEASREAHFLDWVRHGEHISDPEAAQARVRELMGMQWSLHYHVWTQREMVELLGAQQNRLGFDIELLTRAGIEVLIVLRKRAMPPNGL